ncbi:hypothetical protein MHU86_23585 [Fragilaria crotonensis]|nr:hypothetical protein MHU86_23585 [Fragilaria crotonensis]
MNGPSSQSTVGQASIEQINTTSQVARQLFQSTPMADSMSTGGNTASSESNSTCASSDSNQSCYKSPQKKKLRSRGEERTNDHNLSPTEEEPSVTTPSTTAPTSLEEYQETPQTQYGSTPQSSSSDHLINTVPFTGTFSPQFSTNTQSPPDAQYTQQRDPAGREHT